MGLGAVSFWLPDTLWHVVAGSNFGDDGAVLVLALLMPLTLLGTYMVVLNRTMASDEPDRLVGGPMLLGVWLLGGLLVYAGEVGHLFSVPGNVASYVELLAFYFYPPITFEYLIHDGSFFAVVVIAASAPIIWAIRAWYRSHNSRQQI